MAERSEGFGPMELHELPEQARGDFTGKVMPAPDVACPGCGSTDVTEREWESADGAFTDYRYDCGACGYQWWHSTTEGSDAEDDA